MTELSVSNKMPDFGFRSPRIGNSESDPEIGAVYYPTSDTVVIPVDAGTYDISATDRGFRINELVDHDFNLKRYIDHEHGHLKLSKSSELSTRMFLLLMRTVPDLEVCLEHAGDMDISGLVESTCDIYKAPAGVFVYSDAWRPVQEVYADVYAAYQSQKKLGIDISAYLDTRVNEIAENIDTKLKIDLRTPPESRITGDPYEREQFELRYQKRLLTLIEELYRSNTIEDDDQFLKLINYIAYYSSRDVDDGLDWQKRVPRQFLETVVLAHRSREMLPFELGRVNSNPQAVAEGLTKSLGFSIPKIKSPHDTFANSISEMNSSNVNSDIEQKTMRAWKELTETTSPLCVRIQNRQSGSVLPRYRTDDTGVKELIEMASILGEFFVYGMFYSDRDRTFDKRDRMGFQTDRGRDVYNRVVDIVERLEDENAFNDVQSEIKSGAQTLVE